MEWVKTTAKTLPEAIDLALDNLGVDESEAEIVVLEEPRQGLFGRMRGTARVEARVKPKAIRPKTERSRNRKGRGGEGRNRGGDRNKNRNRNRSGGQGGGNRSEKNSGGRNESKQGGDRQKDDNRSKADARSDGGRNESKQGGGGRNRNRSGGQGGGGNGGGRGKSADQNGRSGRSNRRSNNNDYEAKPKEEASVDEVAEHLETFLSGLTEAFGFDSDVTIDRTEDDSLIGRIEGQHGLLVGPKGRTLDAVQELARISCQRTVPSSIRIKVDVGGYRQQRSEALGAFAKKAADSAVETDNEVALEPMSAADRKVIHDALSEDDRVETRSVGTEPRRKVLVVPVVEAEADDDEGDDQVDDVVAEADEELVEAGGGESEE